MHDESCIKKHVEESGCVPLQNTISVFAWGAVEDKKKPQSG
jgi:hypothetical protein